MTATTATPHHSMFHDLDEQHEQRRVSHRITRYLVPLGRVMFALIFLWAGPSHFSNMTIEHARYFGVPWASVLVPAAGLLAIAGGLSVAFGYRARFGAVLLVLFLVPVTLMMHRFWDVHDTAGQMMQRVMFMKNLALLGGALVLAHMGAGPLSIDAAVFKARNDEALNRPAP